VGNRLIVIVFLIYLGARIHVEFLDKFVMSDSGIYVLSSLITHKQIELYPIVKGSHRYVLFLACSHN
jgi:hypothetical protein